MVNKIELKALNKHRFRYSLDAEHAISNVLGERAYQSASRFYKPSFAKKIFTDTVRKLEKRADDIITSDERLRMMVMRNFDLLKKMIGKMDQEFNEISIIALQLELISRLLGFDWNDGKPYRTPIYHRSRREEVAEFHKMLEGGWRANVEDIGTVGVERFRIAKELHEKPMPHNQIARVLGLNDSGVRRLLAISTADRVSDLVSQGKNRQEVLRIITVELGDNFKAFDDYYDLGKFGMPPKSVEKK